MIAAEGLAAADYEIAWVLLWRCGILTVMDEVWARMDPAHRRLRTDVVRRAQPGYVAAPASLLALASGR